MLDSLADVSQVPLDDAGESVEAPLVLDDAADEASEASSSASRRRRRASRTRRETSSAAGRAGTATWGGGGGAGAAYQRFQLKKPSSVVPIRGERSKAERALRSDEGAGEAAR